MPRKHLHILCCIVMLACCTTGAARAQPSTMEMIGDIKNAYENLNFPVAEARIEAALSAFDRFSPVELGEIYRISALIFFARDDSARTRRQLELAVQVNPNLQLSTRDTPPQVITLFEEIVAETESPSDAELRYLIVQDPRPAAVMRSMILPGWGQLYKQQKKKGVLLMSAWGVTSLGALAAHIRRNQEEDHYLASVNLEQIQARYPAFDNWHKIRNNLFLAAAGVWVYSYIDALLQSPSSTTVASQPFRLDFLPAPDAPQLTLSYKF